MNKDFNELFLRVFGPLFQEHKFVMHNFPGMSASFFSYDKSCGLLRYIGYKLRSMFDGESYHYEIYFGISALSSITFLETGKKFYFPVFGEINQRINYGYFAKDNGLDELRHSIGFYYCYKSDAGKTLDDLSKAYRQLMDFGGKYLFTRSLKEYIDESIRIDITYFCSDTPFLDAILLKDNEHTLFVVEKLLASTQVEVDRIYKDQKVEEYLKPRLDPSESEFEYLVNPLLYLEELKQRKACLLAGDISRYEQQVQENRRVSLLWIQKRLKQPVV
jgi:hypothetical protein